MSNKEKINIYEPRFVSKQQIIELFNLYHLARTALCYGDYSKHSRMIWAAQEFHKLNPTITIVAAYKDLSCSLD